MKQLLATLLGVACAIAILLGALVVRDRQAMREADRLRVEADARAVACVAARVRALATLSEMEAVARGCPARVAAGERAAVDAERNVCESLLQAAESRGRLSVPTSDLDAVVAALRARQR